MKSSLQVPPAQVSKKPAAPSKNLRVLTIVSAGLLGAAVLAAVAAILFMTVIEPRRAVAEVRLKEGRAVKITTREFQRRLEFERARIVHQKEIEAARSHPLFGETVEINYRQLSTLGFAGGILERMTREVLIEEAAQQTGLTASAEEIDTLIQVANTVPPPAASASSTSSVATSNPTPTSASVLQSDRLKMNPQELPYNYRDIIRREVLENKLRAHYLKSMPTEEERVQLKLIRFELEPEARTAAASLLGERSFDELYTKVTEGLVPSATGMIHNWSSAGELERDFGLSFSQAVLKLEKSDYLKIPLTAARGWYLAQAIDRGVRTMSEEWRRQRSEDAFRRWLESQQSRITQYPLWMERVPLHPKARQGAFSLDSLPNNMPASGTTPGLLKNGPKGRDREHRPTPGINSKKEAPGNDLLRGGGRPESSPARSDRGSKTIGPSAHTLPDTSRKPGND